MVVFSIVFLKTVSVLLCVIIGFLAGRLSGIDRNGIAELLFYFIAPIVFFAIPASTTLSWSELSITLVVFAISSFISIASYYIYGRWWQDQVRNILSLSAGTGNTGYFVLPVAAALFDDYTLGIYMMAIIGVNIFESTIGFYLCSGATESKYDALLKVLKLPILNAFVLGCIFSLSGLILPDFLDDFVYNMRGAYSILGMIMIGLGLANLKQFEIDFKFTLAAFTNKFLVYPLVVNVFILADRYIMNWYNENYYNALQLLSTAPLAANLIVIASLNKLQPEKVATSVLLSLIFALIYMPIMVTIFLSDLS